MPYLPDILHNPLVLVAGAAVIAFVVARFQRRVPGPAAVSSGGGATATGSLAGVVTRSRWASLSKIAKIAACVVAGAGALAILAAFLAGANPITLGLFAALLALCLSALAILA